MFVRQMSIGKPQKKKKNIYLLLFNSRRARRVDKISTVSPGGDARGCFVYKGNLDTAALIFTFEHLNRYS